MKIYNNDYNYYLLYDKYNIEHYIMIIFIIYLII
jgi:hypothetical protein